MIYETNIITKIGAMQKQLVDTWTDDDYTSMGVTKTQVFEILEYKSVFVLLVNQSEAFDARKNQSKTKLEGLQEINWEEHFEELLPPWPEEEFLRQLATMADKFPNFERAFAVLKGIIKAQKLRPRSRKYSYITF